MDLNERLIAARKHAGYNSAREAAEALGIPYGTYSGHENGNSGFRAPTGELYARRYKVRFEWLMRGRGTMVNAANQLPRIIPVVGYLGAGAVVEPDYEQVPAEGFEQVELPFGIADDLVAFAVKGDSMMPMYREGAVIVVYREQKRPLEWFYGQDAAVRTTDGSRYIKTIMRGPDGTVNLISSNAKMIEGVRLEWVGEIFATLPPTSLRTIPRKGGIQDQMKLRA